jgi:uncharacterized protein (TIGR03435 family)
MTDDMALVREYARNRSEAAFVTLVSRYVNLVHSVALRQVRDAHLAEEVTQATFILLARKAGSLGPKTILSGWLCRTARYVSAEALRSQLRRQKREQEACMQSLLNETEPEAWIQIAPLLEPAMAQLGEKEHNAIVLRFYEGKALKQVGAALGMGEDAARMRINRALEKLRKFFAGRGITLSAAVITAAVSANSVQAAPAGLAAASIAAAAGKGAAAGGSTLALIKATLNQMAWAKLKVAVTVSTAVLVAAGGSVIVAGQIRAHSIENCIQRADKWALDHAPQAVLLRPTRYPGSGQLEKTSTAGVGRCVPWQFVLFDAYGDAYGVRPERMVLPPELSGQRLDFIACSPGNSQAALQREIKRQYGLTVGWQRRETDVLLLKRTGRAAPNLATGQGAREITTLQKGKIVLCNTPISELASCLEFPFFEPPRLPFTKPIFDRTGLTGVYNITLEWKASDDDIEEAREIELALLEQLGLELVPAREVTDVFVVNKAGK